MYSSMSFLFFFVFTIWMYVSKLVILCHDDHENRKLENIRSNRMATYQDRIATLQFFVELVVMFFVYGYNDSTSTK